MDDDMALARQLAVSDNINLLECDLDYRRSLCQEEDERKVQERKEQCMIADQLLALQLQDEDLLVNYNNICVKSIDIRWCSSGINRWKSNVVYNH